jgi:DNA-binding transcriptional LysR family regulator
MQFDVESLRALMLVLDTGGMTRAAEHLGLSQSAVSWKIKRLEERVGRTLLVRQGRSLRPSRDGRILLGYAREIVSLHDEAVARLSSSALTGNVNFGATEEVAEFCMRAVLARFNRVHPGARIDFHVDRGVELDQMLGRGDLDVAVLQVSPDDVRDGDTVLWEDELLWVSALDSTYDEGEVPLITFGETGFYRPIAEASLKAGSVPYRVAFSGPSTASVLSAVEFGLGVAVVSRRWLTEALVEWPRAAGLKPLPPGVTVARSAPGEPSAIASELVADIETELVEPTELAG